MISEERLQEIDRLFWAETNDPRTEEWREDLTPEEAALVAEWDEGVAAAVDKMYADLGL